MKTVITKYPLSTFLIILSFGLLTFTSLFSGLQEYLKLSGADYLRLSSLITMVLTMVSMVLTGTLWLRVKIGHLLFYSSIPIGLIWSINEFVATLSNMGSEKELAMAVTNILLPAFISGLVCALAFFLTPRTEVTTHDDPEVPFKKLVIFFFCDTFLGNCWNVRHVCLALRSFIELGTRCDSLLLPHVGFG